ncbi:MAG: bifunctional diaminohydroxyphosphoribosylaminopyrimidine deaminase/5-amino-6-(5-phosphoribosylamino)uracil reductase RibD [Bacteroidales bacterium]|nr:bifunctional diaminohydroxyphosphoribosylaminopyrimidine deaminase/5-amino-6-(5-phosphoribosylamino)uracil reductase RibD [Bacteroidales bacterium]
METDDRLYMRRCLELAVKALGNTYPNPVVGAVIVCRGRIIGEGYHLRAGEAHAETMAIESVRGKHLLKESTLYVSLEPCSHHGRTPPCAERIIAEGIPRVVVGTTDTSSKVSGRGIQMLREAGCEVVTPILEEEARHLNRRFFTFHEKNRPYVILKWAMSADGFMDIERPEGSPVGPYWITGMTERTLVHRWRASEQVILAGGETIRKDNPLLNVRYWTGNSPVKAIISRSGTMSSDSAIFSGAEVILFTEGRNLSLPGTRIVPIDFTGNDVAGKVLEYLFSCGYQSVLIEGGRRTHEMFLRRGLWDEARIFTGKMSWGKGLPAPHVSGTVIDSMSFRSATLRTFINE